MDISSTIRITALDQAVRFHTVGEACAGEVVSTAVEFAKFLADGHPLAAATAVDPDDVLNAIDEAIDTEVTNSSGEQATAVIEMLTANGWLIVQVPT